MSTPDPEGFSLLGKVLIALGAVGAPIAWAYKVLNGKADKAEVAAQFERVREVQAKIFDQIRDSDQRAQDRHERLLERLPPRGD